jgi:hypothetical protein
MGDRSKVTARHDQIGRAIAADRESKPGPIGVRCSFCSKRQGEVLAMFEGLGAHICNECVGLFAEEVAQRREGE